MSRMTLPEAKVLHHEVLKYISDTCTNCIGMQASIEPVTMDMGPGRGSFPPLPQEAVHFIRLTDAHKTFSLDLYNNEGIEHCYRLLTGIEVP